MLVRALALALVLGAGTPAGGCVLCGDGGSGSGGGGGPRALRASTSADDGRSERTRTAVSARRPPSPLAAFSPPHPAEQVVNATIFQFRHTPNVTACAQHCLAEAPAECIAFTYDAAASSCVGSGWRSTFAVATAPGTTAYYSLVRQANTAPVKPAIRYALSVPTSGVTIKRGPLAEAFQANVQYLLQIPVADMLHWFRVRHGDSDPPGQNWGWDNGGVDAPEGLRGSVAGAFLMGAAGSIRWEPAASGGQLHTRVRAVVQGIMAAQASDGYLMAFPKNESNYHENPDYVTAWLTHGLLEAAISGDPDALPLLRAHFDWFNTNENLPLFLPPAPQGLPFSDSNGNSVRKSAQFDHGHEIYLIYQGMIHNSRLALSKLGQQQDIDTLFQYEEDWWLRQLAARNTSAIWLRSKYPHNYEITAVEAYMDLYQLTSEDKYIEAVDGFWYMFRKWFLHVGGSVAIKEWKLYPPGSYFLDTWGNTAHSPGPGCTMDPDQLPDPVCPAGSDPEACKACLHSTGETCGQVFWIKLNQRLHQLRPENDSYVAEIERVIYNGVISQIPPVNGSGPHRVDPGAGRGGNFSRIDGNIVGIRQFALLHRQKMKLNNISTCCEGQATRLLGSLPEYIFSVDGSKRALYVDMYTDATVSLAAVGLAEDTSSLQMVTKWPLGEHVTIKLAGADANFTLMLRIPAWVHDTTVNVTLSSVAGALHIETWHGSRGLYLPITRSWKAGDSLSFSLPMKLKASRYTGLTTIPGFERFALEYGPILLCAVGGHWNTSIDSMLIRGVENPEQAESWVRPVPGGRPLHFTVVGNAGTEFVPYYEVQEEQFEVFPAFEQSG
jgi:hypothetical protein